MYFKCTYSSVLTLKKRKILKVNSVYKISLENSDVGYDESDYFAYYNI